MANTTDSFRNQITTVTGDGKKRKWMYPKLISGNLYRYRTWVSVMLLGLLFSAPFIRLNGEQLVLLNILERKFVFFGVVFLPQDFYLFVLAMLTFMVFIVLFTVVFGRVWCGWACPQTIFMEMIFRKIEYWIEGDHHQQKKLDAAPLSLEKVAKKAAKHFLFLVISFFIANVFLAYIIGGDALLRLIRSPVFEHLVGFGSIVLFTGVFYLVFARLRELVCVVICPYGRLQGVLLDNQSLQVSYDYVRGEPRGQLRRNSPATKGDCVDCNLCVDVCPTGIDIRNGSQLECIACTACIDACDMVMTKIKKPTRLIGFLSEDQIKNRRPFRMSKRIYAYAAVFLVLLSTFIFLVARRADIEATIYRASGTLYQQRPNGLISNLYTAEFVNKTTRPINFRIAPADPKVTVQYVSKESRIAKDGIARLTFFLVYREDQLKGYKSDVTLDVFSGNRKIDEVRTTFISPYQPD